MKIIRLFAFLLLGMASHSLSRPQIMVDMNRHNSKGLDDSQFRLQEIIHYYQADDICSIESDGYFGSTSHLHSTWHLVGVIQLQQVSRIVLSNAFGNLCGGETTTTKSSGITGFHFGAIESYCQHSQCRPAMTVSVYSDDDDNVDASSLQLFHSLLHQLPSISPSLSTISYVSSHNRSNAILGISWGTAMAIVFGVLILSLFMVYYYHTSILSKEENHDTDSVWKQQQQQQQYSKHNHHHDDETTVATIPSTNHGGSLYLVEEEEEDDIMGRRMLLTERERLVDWLVPIYPSS